jgi:hypothetical protein
MRPVKSSKRKNLFPNPKKTKNTKNIFIIKSKKSRKRSLVKKEN